MKKLLIMTHNMAGGGCERVIAQLADRFAASGTEVVIATEYRAPCFYRLDSAVTLTALTDSPSCRTRDIPRTYRALRKMAMAFRPDVILAMPEKVNVWTVIAMLFSGIPVVVSERNDPRRHPESRIKRLLRRMCYPFAAGFIFQTEQARAYFPARIRRRGVVLDNPLDLARVPEPVVGEREKCIVSAGRLNGQKNFALLIEAFRAFYPAHPDWRLIIYGEGGLRASLAAQAESLPSGVVSLPGQSGTVLSDMQKAGMFVLSSDFEGMPNVLIEAMAMGLACIATDCPCGGPAALIQNDENGLLVPTGDAKALAAAMARIADSGELTQRLGRNALCVRERTAIGPVSEKWREYLDEAAAAFKK